MKTRATSQRRRQIMAQYVRNSTFYAFLSVMLFRYEKLPQEVTGWRAQGPCFTVAHLCLDKLQNTAMETRQIKLQGMIANCLWVKLPLVEGRKGCGQALCCLLAEEKAGHALDNRGQRPACPVSDDGTARSLGFQRRDTEVLFAGEEKGAAVRVIVKHFFVGEPPREADGRPGHPAQPCLVATAADDDQR